MCNSTPPPCNTKNISPIAVQGALPRPVASRSKLVSRIKSSFGDMTTQITNKIGNMSSKFGNMNSKTNKTSNFNSSLGYSSNKSKMENISDDTVLIFYAPWCGHCKRSMNEFKQASTQGNGKIMLINSDEEPEAVKKYNVSGFPTIMKANGETYTGGRDVSSIMDFAKN